MKKVLVIDNYDSFVYNIIQLLKESTFNPDFDVVRNDQVDFSCIEDYGGIILSPGPGIPSEAGDLLRVIEACRDTHPLLGICLGHQAIAQTFGVKLCHISEPLHGHRTVLQQVDFSDPIFYGLNDPVVVGRYHSWIVDDATIPSELLVTSRDEQGHIMSFRHRELPIYGVQFHPESYISNCGLLLLTNWLKLCNSCSTI